MFSPRPLSIPRLSPTIRLPSLKSRASMMDLLLRKGLSGGGQGIGLFTGQFIGDGAATQVITGVGFSPAMVMMYPQANTTHGWGWKTTSDGLNSMVYDTVLFNFRYTTDNIISLDADGFTVGDGTTLGINQCNILNQIYSFVCWKTGTISYATGNYTGDGAATQAVAGLGFQPKIVMIHGNDVNQETYPFAVKTDQDGLFAYYKRRGFGGWRYVVDEVISLDADGFTVGDGTGEYNMMNYSVTLLVYTYYAWR